MRRVTAWRTTPLTSLYKHGLQAGFHKGEYTTLRNLFSQGWVQHFPKLVFTRVSAALCETCSHKGECTTLKKSVPLHQLSNRTHRKLYESTRVQTARFWCPSKRNCIVILRLPYPSDTDFMCFMTSKGTYKYKRTNFEAIFGGSCMQAYTRHYSDCVAPKMPAPFGAKARASENLRVRTLKNTTPLIWDG